jgi:hypothetical protein
VGGAALDGILDDFHFIRVYPISHAACVCERERDVASARNWQHVGRRQTAGCVMRGVGGFLA